MIIGIDPGLKYVGWSILKIGLTPELISSDFIKPSGNNVSERLYSLHVKLLDIILEYKPSIAAVEKIFVNNNPRSSMTLCYSVGVILMTLNSKNLKVFEYSANYVKKTVTGLGHATKDQVRFFIMNIFKLNKPLSRDDCYDSVAVSLCHFLVHKVDDTIGYAHFD